MNLLVIHIASAKTQLVVLCHFDYTIYELGQQYYSVSNSARKNATFLGI